MNGLNLTFSTLPSVAFLDRDGTIILDREYLSCPSGVELIDGAAEAIAMLNAAGIPVVIVTNQSGVGRGYYSMADYTKVHERMIDLLSQAGVSILATYLCPHGPKDCCQCRKPGDSLFLQAIEEHDLDMSNPFFAGDRWRDLAPLLSRGGGRYLVTGGKEHHAGGDEDRMFAAKYGFIVDSLLTAVKQALGRGSQ